MAALAYYWRSRLNEPAFSLNENARAVTLAALLEVCRYRDWCPHALHIRITHVHAVIAGEATPEGMLCDFKAYATRAAITRPARPAPQNRR